MKNLFGGAAILHTILVSFVLNFPRRISSILDTEKGWPLSAMSCSRGQALQLASNCTHHPYMQKQMEDVMFMVLRATSGLKKYACTFRHIRTIFTLSPKTYPTDASFLMGLDITAIGECLTTC